MGKTATRDQQPLDPFLFPSLLVMQRLSSSLSRFETQDIKTQPQFNHYFTSCWWPLNWDEAVAREDQPLPESAWPQNLSIGQLSLDSVFSWRSAALFHSHPSSRLFPSSRRRWKGRWRERAVILLHSLLRISFPIPQLVSSFTNAVERE